MSGPEAYLLPRDEYEKRRLDLQHTVITRHFNGCLPASVAPGPQAKILDTGCGTGVWSIDLAKHLPSTVTFHACDISPDNFPPAGSNETAANVHFAAHSVLAFPSEWSDSFDAIRQRLMQGGITQAEWRAAMKEMHRILRPGGHIVLVEIDHAGFNGALSAPVPAADKISAYWKTRYSQNDRLWDSRSLIPDMLKEAGFQEV
ncbi:S-adenosyl-L-methionine-dependent methyltransferase [Pterulicium gracile]|uniref:S-adenosyl-L-methionine-dependent methyltransferase n=1 Tax=Pterulicium gracile TaxID=1884261 RepID=A0A5C3Q4M7_9AGAR|nr:S-adenosyl-L-methionine-dependent methyltransferase [Pterula gracilis]